MNTLLTINAFAPEGFSSAITWGWGVVIIIAGVVFVVLAMSLLLQPFSSLRLCFALLAGGLVFFFSISFNNASDSNGDQVNALEDHYGISDLSPYDDDIKLTRLINGASASAKSMGN